VDSLSINPRNKNEVVTGSHDKSLKIWDLNKMQKSVATLTGHKEGVWCVNHHKDGGQLVTASPEGVAKLWDIKAGKPTADLKVHTKRVSGIDHHTFQVFWATYSNAGTHVATCGSDRLLAYWDLRKTAAPVSVNSRKT
jgi:WD40 repeat protein